MEDYSIIQPSPILAPYVKHYWLLKTFGAQPTQVGTVPTGMMSLIFHRGNQLLSVSENKFHPRVFLCGQEKAFANLQYTGQIDMLSVVFQPAGARVFFNLPLQKLYNIRVTASDMEDKELLKLEKTLTHTEDNRLCIALIEQFLTRRLTHLEEHNIKRIDTTIRLINSGQTDIRQLSDAACLSTKQFNRVFSEHIGCNPKEFARIIRFQRALHTIETKPQTPLTTLAYQCGYFDQSHMIKDFKALSGLTPSEYIAACPPTSDYFS